MLLLLSISFAVNGFPAETPAQRNYEDITETRAVYENEGFHFNGHHFAVQWFSGSGYVPADPYVYRWTTDPTHYLVEMNGVPGAVIRELTVGSYLTVDGNDYEIVKVESGVPNDGQAYGNMKKKGAALTFQTCDVTIGENGKSDLTIWYAEPIGSYHY